jgi:hypothetical protein
MNGWFSWLTPSPRKAVGPDVRTPRTFICVA